MTVGKAGDLPGPQKEEIGEVFSRQGLNFRNTWEKKERRPGVDQQGTPKRSVSKGDTAGKKKFKRPQYPKKKRELKNATKRMQSGGSQK